MVPSEVLRVNLDVFLTYTRTFSNQEPIPLSKANALSYAHTKDGNDQMHIDGEMTSGKLRLSGFVRSRSESLWWFEVDLWPLRVHFRRGPPPPNFPKAHALRYRHRKFGNDRMYIRGEWALRRWHWIQFGGTGGRAKGDFRWIFGLNPCIIERGPHHFPKAHALRYGYRKFGNDRMYIRGEWALRRWHRMKFEWYRPRC